jgi:hypothetical protein
MLLLDGCDMPGAVTVIRLLVLPLGVHVALILPEGAGWRQAGSVMTLPAASSRIGFCIASSTVAYLSAMAMSSAMVAGSERMSLCFSRVPSLQPSEKY